LILSYGESVKVIEPQHLVTKIKSRLTSGVNLY
jgi:predicted DNA-binding transcriptional regulator YafY